jgi:hypothetical protein
MMKPQFLVLAVALGGCAGLEREQSDVQEHLLARAGFEMRALASGEGDLPAREIVVRGSEERTEYLYADVGGCHCVYAGGREQYERYRWLEARQNVLREVDGGAMNAASIDQP